MKKHAAIKVPGEVPDAPVEQADETVVVSKIEMAAMKARIASLEAGKPVRSKASDLPDQDSIDVSTLKSPVLTKQGWLVPEKHGSNPAVQKF